MTGVVLLQQWENALNEVSKKDDSLFKVLNDVLLFRLSKRLATKLFTANTTPQCFCTKPQASMHHPAGVMTANKDMFYPLFKPTMTEIVGA